MPFLLFQVLSSGLNLSKTKGQEQESATFNSNHWNILLAMLFPAIRYQRLLKIRLQTCHNLKTDCLLESIFAVQLDGAVFYREVVEVIVIDAKVPRVVPQ